MCFIIKMLWKSGIHRSLVLIHSDSWKLSFVRNGPEQMCLVIRIARQFLMRWQLVFLRVENLRNRVLLSVSDLFTLFCFNVIYGVTAYSKMFVSLEPANAVKRVLPFLVRRLLKLSAREVKKDMDTLRCFFSSAAMSAS